MDKKLKFNADTPLFEVLESDRRHTQILMGFGLHCFGCPLTSYETIGEAAQVHGIDLEFLLNKLNEEFED